MSPLRRQGYRSYKTESDFRVRKHSFKLGHTPEFNQLLAGPKDAYQGWGSYSVVLSHVPSLIHSEEAQREGTGGLREGIGIRFLSGSIPCYRRGRIFARSR